MIRWHLIKWGSVAIATGALWVHGYDTGRDSRSQEVAALTAVGAAQTAQARRTTTEVANVQTLYLDAWKRARSLSAAEWVRLHDASSRRVPTVPSECGGADADPGNRVEASGGAGDRDLLPALVDALAQGEALEATLRLCQVELRQCADLR